MRLITTFSLLSNKSLKQVQYEQKQENVKVPRAPIADETNTNRKKEHLLLVSYQS